MRRGGVRLKRRIDFGFVYILPGSPHCAAQPLRGKRSGKKKLGCFGRDDRIGERRDARWPTRAQQCCAPTKAICASPAQRRFEWNCEASVSVEVVMRSDGAQLSRS